MRPASTNGRQVAALADGHADAALPDRRTAPASTGRRARGHDDYVSDPAKPVPFIPRPINMNDGDQWKPWLVHDQRFVSDRTDVAQLHDARR